MLIKAEKESPESHQEQSVFRRDVFIAAPAWEIIQSNIHYANIGNWGIENLAKNALRRFHHAIKVREMLRRTGLGVFVECKEIVEGNDHTAYIWAEREGFSWARTERVIEDIGKGHFVETGVRISFDVYPGAPLHALRHP